MPAANAPPALVSANPALTASASDIATAVPSTEDGDAPPSPSEADRVVAAFYADLAALAAEAAAASAFSRCALASPDRPRSTVFKSFGWSASRFSFATYLCHQINDQCYYTRHIRAFLATKMT